jgi:hypothetical protein
MTAARELATLVSGGDGSPDDVRELGRLWDLSRNGPLGGTEEAAIVRAMYFARAWAAKNRGDETIPYDPFPFECPARRPESRSRLRWREGYGWRRDDEPDGDPLPPIVAKPDSWFRRRSHPNAHGTGDVTDRSGWTT